MLGQVIVTEFLKLRRSKVTWFSLVAISLGPFAIALFMWIVRGRAALHSSVCSARKRISRVSRRRGPAYFSMLTLVVGMGGMLLLSFIVAYVFGREYAEGTAKNLLALPVRRPLFVLAKFVVAAAWWLVLVAAVLAEALIIGRTLGLPGFSAGLAAGAVRDALLAAGIAFLLVPVVAWITTLGQGYMPPLAFALAMMALGNVFAKTGWAAWFPWSIVPLLIGMVGQPVQRLPPGSFVVLAITFTAGITATVLQFIHADNHQ